MSERLGFDTSGLSVRVKVIVRAPEKLSSAIERIDR